MIAILGHRVHTTTWPEAQPDGYCKLKQTKQGQDRQNSDVLLLDIGFLLLSILWNTRSLVRSVQKPSACFIPELCPGEITQLTVLILRPSAIHSSHLAMGRNPVPPVHVVIRTSGTMGLIQTSGTSGWSGPRYRHYILKWTGNNSFKIKFWSCHTLANTE